MPKNKEIKILLTCFANNQAKIVMGITLIAYALSLLQYVQAHDVRTYNSDLLYLPTLFKDLTEWGGHLFEWRLTPAPYFFPDMLIYFAFASVLPNWHIALTLSALTQIVLFTAAWALLGQFFFTEPKQRLAYAAFVVAVVALLLMMPATTQIIQPQSRISTHFGVMLALPYAIGLALRLINGRSNSRRMRLTWTGLLILLGLLALSDAIAYAQLILPLLLAICFLGLLNKTDWRVVWKIVMSVGATLLLTHLLRLWLIRYRPFPFSPNGIETIGNAFTEFSAVMLQDWQSSNRLFLVFLLLAISAHVTIVLLSIHFAVRQREFPSSLSFLSLFSLASILLTVMAVIVASLFKGRGGFRYLFPLTVLPVYTLLPISFYMLRYPKAARLIPLLLALFIIGKQAHSITRVDVLNQYRDHYPPLVACVDAEATRLGLQAGVGTYWDAKYISVLSKTSVKMSQIYPDFSPYVWISNPAWYGRFPPQFVLFNSDDSHPIDMARLINLFGYPQEVVDCDTRELWVYNRPEDIRFQRSFADNPMTVNWCPVEMSVDIPAYVWQIPKGIAKPVDATLVVEGTPGVIAAGRLFQLPEGQYRFDVRYEYEGDLADAQIVADLFVGFVTIGDVEGEIDWQQYSLPAAGETESVMFNVNGKQDVWIRLNFRGEGMLTLYQFQIQKHSKTDWVGVCR